MPLDADELTTTALTAARAAAEVHHHHRGAVHRRDWDRKGVADFVTYVDREAEAEVVETIRAAHPRHLVLAEEASPGTLLAEVGRDGGDAAEVIAGALSPGSGWVWVIDPLDGTTNFLHGYPMYAASVAVLRDGEPLAGAIVSAPTGEEWWASAGGGAHRNDEPIRVSGLDDLSMGLVGTGFPFKALERLPRYLRQLECVLRRSAGVRRAGSAALDLCHLATGWFDGFWELHLAPWDIAAGALIVREAGGVITTLDGDGPLLHGGTVLAGTPAIHAQLGRLLLEADT